MFRSRFAQGRLSRAAIGLCTAAALALPVAAAASRPAAAQAYADAAIDIDYFAGELAPYGSWFQHPRWGDVWRPYAEEFRPYYDGRWDYTEEYGWFWTGHEPFGEIVYHYGRWAFDPQLGWVWVPGYVWGPAWVLWREVDGFVGWFPMPPDYADFYDEGFRPAYAADDWYGYRGWYGPQFSDSYVTLWSFVNLGDFGRPARYRYVTDHHRLHDLYRRSHDRTRYEIRRDRVFNRALPFEHVRRFSHDGFQPRRSAELWRNRAPMTSVTQGRQIWRQHGERRQGRAPADFGYGPGPQQQFAPRGQQRWTPPRQQDERADGREQFRQRFGRGEASAPSSGNLRERAPQERARRFRGEELPPQAERSGPQRQAPQTPPPAFTAGNDSQRASRGVDPRPSQRFREGRNEAAEQQGPRFRERAAGPFQPPQFDRRDNAAGERRGFGREQPAVRAAQEQRARAMREQRQERARAVQEQQARRARVMQEQGEQRARATQEQREQRARAAQEQQAQRARAMQEQRQQPQERFRGMRREAQPAEASGRPSAEGGRENEFRRRARELVERQPQNGGGGDRPGRGRGRNRE